MEKLRVFEAFAGYGSQSMALERLGINFEVVGISEIDKYATQAYMAVHGETKNYGDISKINWDEVPDFDFLTYSFPCQDISNAGVQRGLEEGSGTRSSLLWECKKAIEAKRPKYLLMENVKALTSKKFKPYLNKWTSYLENLGYTCYTKVLNSKNFGVPQNRDRCFMVSILGNQSFFFPEEFPLEKRLKDVLEKNVDEKYYLNKKQVQSITDHCERKVSEGCGFKPAFKTEEEIATCISTRYGGRQTDTFVKEYGNKRVQSLVESGKIDGDHVQFLDAYNQAVSDDVAGTIRTTIDSSCMHFVTEPCIRQVGNIRPDTDTHKNPSSGRVYSKEGIAPTILSRDFKEPKLIEDPKIILVGQISSSQNSRIISPDGISYAITNGHKGGMPNIAEPCIRQVGNIYDNDKNPQAGRIYDSDGISPALDTMSGGNRQPKIIEPNVLTPKRTEYGKAVRRAYESGKIEESRHNMTEMQPRTDGVSNTITTVQKDNLLVEPKVVIPYDDYNGKIPKDLDVIGTIRANNSRNAPRNGYKIIEIEKIPLRIPQATAKGYIEVEPGGIFDGSYPESKTRRGRVQGGEKICPTITATGEPHNVYEGIEYKGKLLKEGDGLSCQNSERFFGGGLDGISPTLRAEKYDAAVVENYRIRKLTPRECFRLMGVLDSDIDKIEAAGISKTQQYRMAGNSIVVDVLCHIYRKMFIEKGCKSVQLSLF